MMVKIMLKQLETKKVDFKGEAMVTLFELNDKLKKQMEEIQRLGLLKPVSRLGLMPKHEHVDIEQQLKNYDSVREIIKGDINQIAEKLKEQKDYN
mmetsp:Transcript_48362/g.105384  ORF Transcript_48362/g.105384 Transcript_48362/m.105384 type:complete len:95 (+) Transcript_48362:1100-1384(+)